MKLGIDSTFDVQEYNSESERLMGILTICCVNMIMNIENPEHVDFKGEFKGAFEKLFTQCLADKYFWPFCPSKLFIDLYNDREQEFLKNNPEFDSEHFVKSEIESARKTIQVAKIAYQEDGKEIVIEPEKFHFEILSKSFIDSPLNFCCTTKVDILKYDQLLYLPYHITLDFLSHTILSNIEKAQKAKLSFLESKLIRNIENPHPRYFKNNGFALFEILKERLVRANYELADFSFIYRQLQEDGYIYKDIKEGVFRDWLQENCQINNNEVVIVYPLKTIEECSPQSKLTLYSEILSSFK